MPDTSSAPYREHPATWRVHGDLYDPVCRPRGPLVMSGIEPLEETWFDASESPVDSPLFLLIPAARLEGQS